MYNIIALRKITPVHYKKKLFEEKEKQIITAVSQQNKQPLLAPELVSFRKYPMLPLLHPILYLPSSVPQHQTTINKIQKRSTISIKEFKNSNNQDRSYYKDPPLTTAETTNPHFNIQNKRALIQDLFEGNSIIRMMEVNVGLKSLRTARGKINELHYKLLKEKITNYKK